MFKRKEQSLLNKLENYFKYELQNVKRNIYSSVAKPKEVKNNALQRMLGITLFMQKEMEVDSTEVTILYDIYKEKIEEEG